MICPLNYGLNNIIVKQDEVFKNWKFNGGFIDDPCKINFKNVVFCIQKYNTAHKNKAQEANCSMQEYQLSIIHLAC